MDFLLRAYALTEAKGICGIYRLGSSRHRKLAEGITVQYLRMLKPILAVSVETFNIFR